MKRSEFLDETGIDVSKSEWDNLKMHIGDNDFYIYLDGGEYRFIKNDCINSMYESELQDFIIDNYLSQIPQFIEIDWDETINNCMMDGYGNHFATFDGEEHYIDLDDYAYYYFRTN